MPSLEETLVTALVETANPNASGDSEQTNRDVQVCLQYLADDPLYETQKPLQITPNFLDREGRTNVKLRPGQPEIIKDVRGKEEHFKLDRHGFRYVNSPTQMQTADWQSQATVASKYLPELETLLKREVDGCDEILFYDARMRQAGDEGIRMKGLSFNPFARQVHTDNTETSVITKIRNLTDMKADYVMSGRCRIINIWRPIKHPVYDCGLAITDGGKLREGDIIECDRHRQDTGEFWDTMGVAKYRPGYDWYYMSQMTEPDILLFKNYDSATDVQARTCLHTAFDLPAEDVPPGAPTRESIEVRALIFTYPQTGRNPDARWPKEHPLAESLQKGHLKVVDCDYSLTDRLRTDIDEGSEVKDAILLLRRKEIRRLQKVQAQLTTQRDALADEVKRLKDQSQARPPPDDRQALIDEVTRLREVEKSYHALLSRHEAGISGPA